MYFNAIVLAPESIVFAVNTLIAIFSAFNVLSQKSAVYSALFLIANFFCLAVYYLLLSAQFLAVVQIIVYAGAIMVLFLFVVTLLTQGREEPGVDKLRSLQVPTMAVGVILGFVLAGAIIYQGETGTLALNTSSGVAFSQPYPGSVLATAIPNVPASDAGSAASLQKTGQDQAHMGEVQGVGMQLFRLFIFPFEVTSLLLLVAMLGAIILAKRKVA